MHTVSGIDIFFLDSSMVVDLLFVYFWHKHYLLYIRGSTSLIKQLCCTIIFDNDHVVPNISIKYYTSSTSSQDPLHLQKTLYILYIIALSNLLTWWPWSSGRPGWRNGRAGWRWWPRRGHAHLCRAAGAGQAFVARRAVYGDLRHPAIHATWADSNTNWRRRTWPPKSARKTATTL